MQTDPKTLALEKIMLAAAAHECGYQCGRHENSACQDEH